MTMVSGYPHHHHHQRPGHRHLPHRPHIDLHQVWVRLEQVVSRYWPVVVLVGLLLFYAAYKRWDYERQKPQREADTNELLRRRAVDNADRLEAKGCWKHQRALERVVEKEERRTAKEQARREGERGRWRWWGRCEP